VLVLKIKIQRFNVEGWFRTFVSNLVSDKICKYSHILCGEDCESFARCFFAPRLSWRWFGNCIRMGTL